MNLFSKGFLEYTLIFLFLRSDELYYENEHSKITIYI